MALHTKSDFAKQCGMKTGNLTVYVSRGKVILTENGEVDDSMEINSDFLAHRTGKKSVKLPAPQSEKRLRMIRPDQGTEDIPEIPDTEDEEQEEADDDDDDDSSGYALNKKFLKKKIQKMAVDTRLQEIKEQKIKGQVVPVDIMTNVFRAHTQSIVTAQKDGIEEMLIDLSVEARLKGDQLARLRGKMVEILNKAVDRAAATTQRNLKTILQQVAVKKEVGEHG